jgi:hypothetical protein
MITVTPRATIQPEVLEWYQEAAKRKLDNIRRIVQARPKEQQEREISFHKVELTSLVDIARGVKEPGKGLDLVLARLRSLDYAEIKIQQEHLMGFTRELQIEQIHEQFQPMGRRYKLVDQTVGYWDAGAYAVCIPLDKFERGVLDSIHFVPQRAPRILDRHMHHYAYGLNETSMSRGRDAVRQTQPGGPLKWSTHTCWGEFASVVAGSLNSLDLVETMRNLRAFVGRFYDGSPLINPRTPRTYPETLDTFMNFKPAPGWDSNGRQL